MRSRLVTVSGGRSTSSTLRGGQAPIQLTNDRNARSEGLAWLPDSSGIVFASARGSTFPYLPALALWQVGLGRPISLHGNCTPPEASYEQPDLHPSGLLAVTRVRMRFDIWRYPFDGTSPRTTWPVRPAV